MSKLAFYPLDACLSLASQDSEYLAFKTLDIRVLNHRYSSPLAYKKSVIESFKISNAKPPKPFQGSQFLPTEPMYLLAFHLSPQ